MFLFLWGVFYGSTEFTMFVSDASYGQQGGYGGSSGKFLVSSDSVLCIIIHFTTRMV